MAENNKTTLENKSNILGDLWLSYRDDEEWADFIEFSDIGLPLSYMVSNNIVSIDSLTPQAEAFINETFELLLRGLEIEEDTGFELLEDLLDG